MGSLFQRRIPTPALPAPAAVQAATGVSKPQASKTSATPAAAANSAPLAITAATWRVAMLSVMADRGTLDVGTQLTLVELMAAWGISGLRADDMSAALNESLTDRIIEFHGNGIKSFVTLTAAGYEWLRSAWASGEFMKQRRILDFIRDRPRTAGLAEPPHFRDRRVS